MSDIMKKLDDILEITHEILAFLKSIEKESEVKA